MPLGMLMKDLRLGGEFYDVVSCCCNYNSSARYETMADFADARITVAVAVPRAV